MPEAPFPAPFGVHQAGPVRSIPPSPRGPGSTTAIRRNRAPGREETLGKTVLQEFSPCPQRCWLLTSLVGILYIHPTIAPAWQSPATAYAGYQTADAKYMRWIQRCKRGRNTCGSKPSSILLDPSVSSHPKHQPKEGRCPWLAPGAIPSLFPSPQSSAWPQVKPRGKERLDETSPFCSTKLVSRQHWAYNYYFLKDEPSSYRQKKSLLVGAGI